MEELIQSRLAEEIAADAYIELATYTAKTRNYPGLLDGMKTAYRRLVYQSRIYKNRVKSATLVGECLTGDTEIILDDFRRVRLDELWKYSDHKILSYNNDERKFEFTNWFDLRVVNEVTELVELELDTGTVIRCTPDHLFLAKQSNSRYSKRCYEKAENLLGRSLVPANVCGKLVSSENISISINDIPDTNNYGYVYKITNLINESIYIGQHKGQFDPSYMGSGIIIGNAIAKYGTENFSIQILDYAESKDDLNNKEIYWISEYRKTGIRMYNLATGGNSRNRLSGFHYYNNGKISIQLYDYEEIPEGFIRGQKPRRSLGRSTGTWYTNGISNRLIQDGQIIPNGWYKGLSTSYTPERRSEITRRMWSKLSRDERIARSNNFENFHKFTKSDYHNSFITRIIKFVNKEITSKGDKLSEEIYSSIIRKYRGRCMMPSYDNLLKYFESYDELEDLAKNYNHQVVRVTIVKLDNPEKVYDVSVATNHNFVLASGVISHNCLKIHPHGDESAYSVLVAATCKYSHFPLFNGKGNFGGLGFGSSASRYTESVLSDIARLLYLDLVDYAEYEEGEVSGQEPSYLPALIPYCFLQGSSGFSVGLPTPNIPPMNVMSLIDYYINYLEGKSTEYPYVDYGGVIINSNKKEYSDPVMKNGTGRLWYGPSIIQEDYNKLSVSEITPNGSIDKVNKKLAYQLDNGIVDFIDETSETGYRFVWIINNPNKYSIDELKKVIINTMTTSESYRFIFEYKSRVYAANFDFVVKYQLKYLRECVIRKYQDYLRKSISKSKVLEAIDKLRNNPDVISKLHTYTKDELVLIIMSWGFDKDTANSASGKPITYLTRSHDSEYESELNDQKSYQEYIDNPDKYLLEKYYQLRTMISEFYSSRSHSVFLDDVEASKNNRFQISTDHTHIEFGNNKQYPWDSIIYDVTGRGYIEPRVISKINYSNVMLRDLENDHHVSVLSDYSKYFVMITDNWSIYVIARDRVKSGLNKYVNLWNKDDARILDCISTENEVLTLIDSKNNRHEIILKDYVKSRVSQPSYITKDPITSYINDSGDVVEISHKGS